MGKRIIIARKWRLPRVVLVLFAIELGLAVAALALSGIADPDLYRTKLWQDGAKNGFNSDPDQLLYDYANHLNPKAPLVWSSFITTFNLVIAVLVTFIMLVKSVMFVMHTWVPLLSLITHMILTALFAFSTYAQLSSDKSDPDHLQDGPPWYITKGCGVLNDKHLQGYCQQAQASVGVAAALTALLFAQVILAAISVIPSRMEKALRGAYDEDTDSEADYVAYQHAEPMYEPEKTTALTNAAYLPPPTPRTPYLQRPLSSHPTKPPFAFTTEQEDYEMAVLQKRDAEARLEAHHQRQQQRQSIEEQHYYHHQQQQQVLQQQEAQQQNQSSFAQNLMNTYLQHSPARAITTSERTPDFPHESPRQPREEIKEIPFFAPPPTAPTPRTAAFNRLSGKDKKSKSKSGEGKSKGRGIFGLGGKSEGEEKLSRKERKAVEEAEKGRVRKAQVERYLALQEAGPPGRFGGSAGGLEEGIGRLPFREQYGS